MHNSSIRWLVKGGSLAILFLLALLVIRGGGEIPAGVGSEVGRLQEGTRRLLDRVVPLSPQATTEREFLRWGGHPTW